MRYLLTLDVSKDGNWLGVERILATFPRVPVLGDAWKEDDVIKRVIGIDEVSPEQENLPILSSYKRYNYAQ